MEATANNVTSVHVLRHSFRPSEHLGTALEQYMKKGATHAPFLLYATRLITLRSDEHPMHEINLDYDKVNKDFIKRQHEYLTFGKDSSEKRVLHTRVLANGALRIGILPSNYEVFSSLISGFDELPNDVATKSDKPVKYFLHADISAQSLDISNTEAASSLIEEELSVRERARMYYAIPSAVDHRVIAVPATRPRSNQYE